MSNMPAKTQGRPISHGIRFWLRHGKINPSIRGYKKLQKFLEDLEKQLIGEQGGLMNLTAARELLVRSTIRAYGVILLTELYISKYSVIRPDMAKRGVLQYQPILEKSYWGAQAQIRQNLLALGLDRNLAEIIRQVDEENVQKAATEKAKREVAGQEGQGKASEGEEIVEPGANGEDIPGQGEGHE
jgi:hypothetical protein